MEEVKNPLKSKTLWINVIVAIVAFIPSVKEVLSVETITLLMTTINIILRLVTKEKIGLEL